MKSIYLMPTIKSPKTILNNQISLKPFKIIEIVIDKKDTHVGSGANFFFNWALKHNNLEPLFEAVMMSTSWQQGISFNYPRCEVVSLANPEIETGFK